MSYQSLIDDAISRARVKVASGLPQPTDKLASAVGHDNVLVEAEKLANALEYLSLSVADDGTAVGAARADMVRDFFKTAAEADKKKGMAQPLVTETSTAGTQGVAPQAGKAKLNPQGLVAGNSPKQTTAPDGAMSRNALEQTPPANPTKSASLYDMLMGARMAKIADDAAAPRQMDAEDKAPAHPMGQEGGHAQSPLSSTERIVAAKRKELHAPSRARLGEILAHAGDTAPSMASAQAVAPQAAAKGGLKVATSPMQMAGGGAALGSVLGAGAGALTARKGERGKGALRGAAGGALAGGLAAGLGGRALEKADPGILKRLAEVRDPHLIKDEMLRLGGPVSAASQKMGRNFLGGALGGGALAGASTHLGKKHEEPTKSAAASPAQIAKAVAEAKKEEEKEKREEKAEKKASAALIAREMFKQADGNKEEPTKHPFLASTAKGTLKGTVLGGAAGLGAAYGLAKAYPKAHAVLNTAARHGIARAIARHGGEAALAAKHPRKAAILRMLAESGKPVSQGISSLTTGVGAAGGAAAGAGLGAAYGMGRRKGRKDMSEAH